MIRSALMNVMTAAAMKAGRGLKRDFGEVENLQVSVKGPGDFVTAADRRAEKTLFEELSRARPGYCFLMEESGAVEGADKSHVWHIDPLDGTSNFLHGIPIFAVSVALEREGQIVAGLVYNPASDDLYVAEKGQGAFHNNRRMRVAARRTLAEFDGRLRHTPARRPRPSRALSGRVGRRHGENRQYQTFGRRRDRPRHGRVGPMRRILGTRHPNLGHSGRRYFGEGSGRLRHGPLWRPGHADEIRDLRGQ